MLKRKIVFILFIVALCLFGTISFVNKNNVTVFIGSDIEIEFGKVIDENIRKSHVLESAYTEATSNDDIFLFPRDTTLYKSLRILTKRNKVFFLQIELHEKSIPEILLLTETIFNKNEMKLERVENQTYQAITNRVFYSFSDCNNKQSISVLDMSRMPSSRDFLFY